MLLNHSYLLLFVIINGFVHGEMPKKILGDPSLFQLLNRHYTSVHSPISRWSPGNYKSSKYLYQQTPYYYMPDNISNNGGLHPHSSNPSTGKLTSIKNTENFSNHHSHYSSQEYWRPTFDLTRHIYDNKAVDNSKPNRNIVEDTGESSNPDSLEASHSIFHYQRTRPTVHTHSAVKNSLSYYSSEQIPTKGAEAVGKLKYKKTIYPRLHKPYAMNKYPITKTVYPPYRRYYHSSPQRYKIPSEKPSEYYGLNGYYTTSQATRITSPTLSTYRYPTTERIDDAYANDMGAFEDYSNYKDTDSNSSTSSYQAEHKVEDSTSDLYESHLDESTTRGYYGDRIYMSTQMPIKSWDYLNSKNKHYIVQKIDDDNIETVF